MKALLNSKRVLLSLCAGMIVLAACSSGAMQPTSAPTAAEAVPATQATAEPTRALPTETVVSDAVTAEPTVEVEATESAATTEPAVAAVTKLNLNTATDEELLTVPNTGQRMLREFKEYRPYDSILQFRREIGKYVDEAQVAEYEKYVYVPVSPNNADAATLQQLPGVDQAIADQLVAARPYATSDDFIKKLAELVTPAQLAVGQAYVEAAE